MFQLNSEKVDIPSKSHQQKTCVQALLTDLYQITMAYSYWKAGKTKNIAVFDLFFRKNPFQGEFTIFAGLEECIQYLEMFHFSDSDIEYLKQQLPPTTEDKFFEFLSQLTAKDVTVHAFDEGTVAFPRVPLLRLEGPLIIVQLLETALLTMVNFSSLIATNAARYRIAAGNNLSLIEIGLRRAQGPNGALSASKYSYIGGFDGTSNVLAGKIYNIPVKGTQVHSYIMSFSDLAELRTTTLFDRITGKQHDLLDLANKWREKLVPVFQIVETEDFNNSELAALISFAIAFPDGFFALINTYGGKKKYYCRMQRTPNTQNINGEKGGAAASPNGDCTNNFNQNPARSRANVTNKYSTITDGRHQLHLLSEPYNHSSSPALISDSSVRTGLLNFCAVALSLNDLGYRAVGIRIDNGDLSYLSNAARHYFSKIAEIYQLPWFAHLMIMASNNINEETILSLNEQGHEINCFGIGTHLVTCQKQPALGCVYKMVEINGQARIKLSQELAKVTMPGRKDVYRLYSESGYALVDLLQRSIESPPDAEKKVLCRHPFEESKRAYVAPAKIECMLKLYWQNGKVQQPMPSLEEIRKKVFTSLKTLRTDIKRNLNPTPFKVAVSDDLYNFIHHLWLENAPIGELS